MRLNSPNFKNWNFEINNCKFQLWEMFRDVHLTLVCVVVSNRSVGGVDILKIEEMEKMLKEAQLEKARLIDSRVRHNHQATD